MLTHNNTLIATLHLALRFFAVFLGIVDYAVIEQSSVN